MNCSECRQAYQLTDLFALPTCEHKYCQECATNLIFHNTPCSRCQQDRTSSITPINPKAIPRESLGRACQVLDQCAYLDYVHKSFTMKGNEQYEYLLDVIQKIENNYTRAINQINETKQAMLNEVYKINEENLAYFNKLSEEILEMKNYRIQMKSKFGEAGHF